MAASRRSHRPSANALGRSRTPLCMESSTRRLRPRWRGTAETRGRRARGARRRARRPVTLSRSRGRRSRTSSLADCGNLSSISPRALRYAPVPPVIASTVLPVSLNGPSTVIWPDGRNVVHVHSQELPTTMRIQDPWSVPTLCVSAASKTSFPNVRMLPTTSLLGSPLVTASVSACSTTVIVLPAGWCPLPLPALELTATASTAAATRSAAAITRFISTSLSSSRWEPSPREPPISRRLCFGFTGGQQVSRTWRDANTPRATPRAPPSRAVAYSRGPIRFLATTRHASGSSQNPGRSVRDLWGQRLDHDPRRGRRRRDRRFGRKAALRTTARAGQQRARIAS